MKAVRLAIIVAALAMLSVAAARTVRAASTVRQGPPDCTQCAPDVYNYARYLIGSYTVCFLDTYPGNPEWSFTEGEVFAMAEGINQYWNAQLDAAGAQISFGPFIHEQICPSGSIVIRRESLSSSIEAQTHMTEDGNDAIIDIRSDLQLTGDFWKNLAAHEIGHVLDFKDVYDPQCEGKTIMWHVNSLPWAPARCSDSLAVQANYQPANVDYFTYFTPPNCYDQYLVYYYSCWDGTGWYYCGSSWYYITTWCG